MKVDAVVLNRSIQVTVDELCEMCRVNREAIHEMVDEGIIDPVQSSEAAWLFHGYEIRKAQIALSLQRDLHVNLPGVAVILNLLEEIEELRSRLK